MPRLPPLILAAALLAAAAPPAMAQQAETITVTAAPASRAGDTTTVLGAAEIARSGASNLGDLLNQLPSFGTQGVNGAANDGGYGEYFVDLRNLNFNRTLVLVDGKRFVLSGIQTDEAVDLNSIPVAFIDHVEVLRDGTQPRYAADAVAGVVNVVLRNHVDGLHLDTYGGGATAGGAGTAEVSLTGGHSLPDGHLAFGLDVYRRDPVLQSDRGWAAEPIASALGSAAGPQFLFGSPATEGGHAIGPGVDAVALGGGRTRAYDPAQDDFNPAPGRFLQGGLQRATFYADADTRLTDNVSADAELLFTDRRATNALPPAMLGLNGTQRHPDGFVVPGADPFNPFGEAVTLARTVAETGPQETTTSGPVWRVLGGLDGSLGTWDWSVGYNHGQSFSRYDATNQIDLTRALATVGDGACPGAAGSVAADWFGPGSLSRQALSYIAYTGKTQSRYAETQGLARIGGPVGTLPGGTARLSLGGEIRSEAGSSSVDAVTARGDQAGPDAAATSGGYKTYEAFGTADLPLLRDLPGIRALSLQLAGRETATSRYGGLPVLRAAVDYAPLPGVHLHAITGTARRPPAITEAFGGITATAQEVADPCDAANGLRGNPVVAANCAGQGAGARLPADLAADPGGKRRQSASAPRAIGERNAGRHAGAARLAVPVREHGLVSLPGARRDRFAGRHQSRNHSGWVLCERASGQSVMRPDHPHRRRRQCRPDRQHSRSGRECRHDQDGRAGIRNDRAAGAAGSCGPETGCPNRLAAGLPSAHRWHAGLCAICRHLSRPGRWRPVCQAAIARDGGAGLAGLVGLHHHPRHEWRAGAGPGALVAVRPGARDRL